MRQNQCDPRRLDQFLNDRVTNDFERDVEEHLLACAGCRNRLDELAGGVEWWDDVQRYLGAEDGAQTSDDGAPRRYASTNLDFLQPSEYADSLGRLGVYEILEVIGQGGMGIVLKALDPALNRLVAIKVLAADHAARGAARKRFAREAQAVAAVVHDHIVSVHAVNADSTPPYLVMAFISGQSLQQRIDRSGPLELKEILRIGMQTAAGLSAAHAQGLVHRDIKPANIMLENGIERVRITDFGLARAIDDASVTQNGAVAGTPQYMAPEQARGEVIDQRADLYSLGSVLYTMATGRAPYHGDGGLAVIRQVCDVDPAPVRSINPDVPPWLEGIIRKLHAKDVTRRFQSASEVAELLEQCLAHVQEPGSHRLPRTAEALGRQVYPPVENAPPHWRWLAASVLALIVTGSIIYYTLRHTANHEKSVSEASTEPSSATISELESAGDMFHENSRQVRTGLTGLQNSLRPLYGESMGQDATLAMTRQRAEFLRSELQAFTGPSLDPLESEFRQLRRRLEQLRQGLNRLSE